ncbi:C40 family peptidase [bacterium]|nr:C40 family peptidase [bacterium]
MKMRALLSLNTLLLSGIVGSGSCDWVGDKEEVYVVSVPVASVYADIYDDSERVTQVLGGDVVIVKKRDAVRSLFKIIVPDQYRESYGYPGWMERRYLSKVASTNRNNIFVSEPVALVYSSPNIKSDTIGKFYAFSSLQCDLKFKHHSFCSIKMPGSGRVGYVLKSHVSRDYLPAKGKEIIKSAWKFKGTPYLWGGLSASGIDCSGFVYIVCKMHGLLVPRDADQQFLVGRDVARDELAPGDTVFFGKDYQNVGHVGFYLGDDYFLDASGRNGVNRSSLKDPKYIDCYLGAKRFY